MGSIAERLEIWQALYSLHSKVAPENPACSKPILDGFCWCQFRAPQAKLAKLYQKGPPRRPPRQSCIPPLDRAPPRRPFGKVFYQLSAWSKPSKASFGHPPGPKKSPGRSSPITPEIPISNPNLHPNPRRLTGNSQIWGARG